MAITNVQKERINKMCPVAKEIEIGTNIQSLQTDVENLQNRVAAYQADSTAADVATIVADFNALLAKLRAAGLMAES